MQLVTRIDISYYVSEMQQSNAEEVNDSTLLYDRQAKTTHIKHREGRLSKVLSDAAAAKQQSAFTISNAENLATREAGQAETRQSRRSAVR